MNYYNEFDPFAAAWLQRLIDEGLIPPGYVDTRSITEVQPEDVVGFTQCHFFAGIGGWSYALQLAGWPEDRQVWTGSCPCQPFSTAGKRQGVNDERHLWPQFARLIGECQPPVVFGEQVASKDGRLWLSGVRVDLEEMGYAVGAADLCAASIGAPHIRQRLYWGGVADTPSTRRHDTGTGKGDDLYWKDQNAQRQFRERKPTHTGEDVGSISGVALTGSQSAGRSVSGSGQSVEADGGRASGELGGSGSVGGVGHPLQPGLEGLTGDGHNRYQPRRVYTHESRPTTSSGSSGLGEWGDLGSVHCADGKIRRAPSGIPLLAHGVPNRVGRLRGFGNAIVPPLAAEFVQAFEEARA